MMPAAIPVEDVKILILVAKRPGEKEASGKNENLPVGHSFKPSGSDFKLTLEYRTSWSGGKR